MLEPPIVTRRFSGQLPPSKRDCSVCGEPLVYFTTGPLAGEWILAISEQARRRDLADVADAA